ncbi:DNA polymerase III subunit gamma/tau [Fundidesulfovibrio putealis]|uniref:DNA polymerase III subunit gamma/tau n=1 Tax=Fundidesulfovibrio putealis TaxID=270496 RepID=UPI00041548D7|nr:DNA polymerase III subunit gamma/tau [Fundidesulfovibrio putealis]
MASLTAKYRPQRFSDVAGQESIKRILSRASAEDKIAPAYLFSGTRGVGKTTLARVLAKALNCLTAPTSEPCNECSQCRQITAGISPDVIEIDAATHGTVDEARRLKEDIGYAPLQSRYKVFIIDEAHMLSKQAFNALLKTLEEPPGRVTFILATTEPHKILPTIISRCQHYVFKRLAQPELEAHLSGLLGLESMGYEPSAVSLIARRGAGSVRDSMSLLAQVLAMGGETLREQDVRDVLGLAGQDVFLSLMQSFKEQDCLGVSTLLRNVLDRGLDIGFFLRELAACWRDMFLLNQSGEKALDNLELSEEEGRQWLAWAGQFDARHIHACWQMTLEGQRRVMTSLEPALALELLLLNLAYIPKLLSLDALNASGGTPPGRPGPGSGAGPRPISPSGPGASGAGMPPAASRPGPVQGSAPGSGGGYPQPRPTQAAAPAPTNAYGAALRAPTPAYGAQGQASPPQPPQAQPRPAPQSAPRPMPAPAPEASPAPPASKEPVSDQPPPWTSGSTPASPVGDVSRPVPAQAASTRTESAPSSPQPRQAPASAPAAPTGSPTPADVPPPWQSSADSGSAPGEAPSRAASDGPPSWATEEGPPVQEEGPPLMDWSEEYAAPAEESASRVSLTADTGPKSAPDVTPSGGVGQGVAAVGPVQDDQDEADEEDSLSGHDLGQPQPSSAESGAPASFSAPKGPPNWPGFLKYAQQELHGNNLLKTALKSVNGTFEGDESGWTLMLSCPNFQASQIRDKSGNLNALQTLANEYFGRQVRIQISAAAARKQLSQQELRAKAEQAPLFQEARESMGAYIIDVRAKH